MTTPILKMTPRAKYPGDRAYILTAPATDTHGRTHPRGTVLTPLAGGMDNVRGSAYLDATIDGERATFLLPAAA